MHQSALEDQRRLVLYLDNIIGFLESKIATEPPSFESDLPASIAASVKMILHILNDTSYGLEEKKRIFQQMRLFANTCPGLTWSEGDKTWSQNKIYNGATNKSEIVTASLAETLNLVCRSVSDESRYVSSSEEDNVSSGEKDMRLRIVSFCESLFKLQQQYEQKEYAVCAAGRQHELLFLLDHAYLDCDKSNPGAKRIELITNESTFLSNQLSHYIQKEMSLEDEDKRSRLIVDWLLWDCSLISSDHAPVIIFLRKRHPASSLASDQDCEWKAGCSTFVREQCKLFGIDPTPLTRKIEEYLANVRDLALPIPEGSVTTPLLAAIMTAQPMETSMSSGSSAVNWRAKMTP